LISGKKFSTNDFMKKSHALAVIDLADTCKIFEENQNWKAAGVCYNNIANFQYKNEAYFDAEKNFNHALNLADKCTKEQEIKMVKQGRREYMETDSILLYF